MAPIVDAIERSRHGPVRVVCASPPQHGKTILVKSALIQRMADETQLRRCAFATFNTKKAEEESLDARRAAAGIGLQWTGTLGKWQVGRNSIKWVGIGGGLTGSPIDDLIVIDDPFKDWDEAKSPVRRQRVWDWYDKVVLTRLHPNASVIIIATRWHPDDLSGKMIDRGWEYINLEAVQNDEITERIPATSDSRERAEMAGGKPLWPARRPMSWYEERRAETDEYTWSSMYQGQPTPTGNVLFGPEHYFTELPKNYRVVYGTDLAYTSSTSSDFSVLVRMLWDGDRAYITDVWRAQVQAPQFAAIIFKAYAEQPGPMLWHHSGTEKGSADFIREKLSAFYSMPAVADKFRRALPASTAWDRGRILLPGKTAKRHDGTPFWPNGAKPKWLDPFLNIVKKFTGVKDTHDDDVDALGSAWAAATGFKPRSAANSLNGYQLV